MGLLLVTNQPRPENGTTKAREARIAALRRKYQAGTYRVDGDKLSAKIIDAHLQPRSKPSETR